MSHENELNFIKKNIDNLPQNEIIKIYSTVASYLKNNNYTSKIEAILTIINLIFKNINKKEINSLDEFSYIKKNDVFNEDSNKIVENNLNILFGPFCKTKYKYYMRNTYKYFFYSFLRNACQEVGYELINIKVKKENFLTILKC